MSTFIKMYAVCGSGVSTAVDIFDAELNPHGIRCCDACESIIAARESWADFYNYDFIAGVVYA